MRAPEFWQDSESVLASVLEPAGRIVGAVTTWRATRPNPPRAPIPVISVGGVTVGGAGKTPVAAEIARQLAGMGQKPAVLLRGYGGRVTSATRVDPARHTVDDVGDEALIHAAVHPTWVARRRIVAACLAAADGCTIAVLDDGHQHPGLHKDLSIVVLDGRNPFGNQRLVPAGPLREYPDDAIKRAQAVVIVGEDKTNVAARLPGHVVVLRADLVPDPAATALRGRRVVAFAGIGDPKKFFATLNDLGAQIAARYGFEDHHAFGPSDIQPILDQAFAMQAIPVTTEKDAVRLAPDQRQQVDVVKVAAVFRDPGTVEALLRGAVPGG
ncbi:MAG: tetraacyldisaccharide 4'-kinase [Rhodobacteraceae bacterium]|nr:tetraacyldisaccharide 4'-kinase [Paracoccaceae bacterium]